MKKCLLFAILLITFCKINLYSDEFEVLFEYSDSKSFGTRFEAIGNTLFFTESFLNKDSEVVLWTTDGTRSGTQPVVAINKDGQETYIHYPGTLKVIGETLFLNSVIDSSISLSRYDLATNKFHFYEELASTGHSMIYPSSMGYSVYYLQINSNIIMVEYGPNPRSRAIIDITTNEVFFLERNPSKVQILDSTKVLLFYESPEIELYDLTEMSIKWTFTTPYSNSRSFIARVLLIEEDLLLYHNNPNVSLICIDINDGTNKKPPFERNFIPVDYEKKIFTFRADSIDLVVITNDNFEIIDTIAINMKAGKFRDKIILRHMNDKHLITLLICDPKTKIIDTLIKNILLTDYMMIESFPSISATINNKLITSYHTLDYGKELFVLDEDKNSFSILKDIFPGPANSLYSFSLINQSSSLADKRIIFNAFSPDYGYSIWISDGTEEVTLPVFSFDDPNHTRVYNRVNTFATEDMLYFHFWDNHKRYLLGRRIKPIEKLLQPKNYEVIENAFVPHTSSYSNRIYLNNLLVDNNQNIYISGNAHNNNNVYPLCFLSDNSTDTNFRISSRSNGFLIKFDEQGKRLFTHFIPDNIQFSNVYVAADSVNNIYTSFVKYDSQKRRYTLIVQKINENGHLIWERSFEQFNNPHISDIQADDEGNVYLLLRSHSRILKFFPDGKFTSKQLDEIFTDFSFFNMAVRDDRIYITGTEMSEQSWSTCKYKRFYNMIHLLDLDLNIAKTVEYSGDDLNYIADIGFGFGGEIIVAGSYRGELDLFGKTLSSDKISQACNIQTSYLAYFDENLNFKHSVNFNPEPIIFSSLKVKDDYNLYIAGVSTSVNIDSTFYRNRINYPSYDKESIAIKEFSYLGEELAHFYYSKGISDGAEKEVLVNEFKGRPLVYDIYSGRVNFLPTVYADAITSSAQSLVLFQPDLNTIEKIVEKPRQGMFVVEWNDAHGTVISTRAIHNFETEISYQIYSTLGQFVHSDISNLINGSANVQVPKYLASGVYYIQINYNGISETLPLVIAR